MCLKNRMSLIKLNFQLNRDHWGFTAFKTKECDNNWNWRKMWKINLSWSNFTNVSHEDPLWRIMHMVKRPSVQCFGLYCSSPSPLGCLIFFFFFFCTAIKYSPGFKGGCGIGILKGIASEQRIVAIELIQKRQKHCSSQEKCLFSGAVSFASSCSPSKILASPKLSEWVPRHRWEFGS